MASRATSAFPDTISSLYRNILTSCAASNSPAYTFSQSRARVASPTDDQIIDMVTGPRSVCESISTIREAQGATDIFIYPPYRFRNVDVILTNFHLPKSTLLMMMSAFAGRELMLKAYAEAVKQKYRFFSYGDCMLIL